jgi:hypothetical protein
MRKSAWLLILALWPAAPALALPDCTPDAVFSFSPTGNAGYGHDQMPDVVLGLPANSLPTQQSLDVVSLGFNGEIILEFTDNLMVDGPGPDLIVFENPFFVGQVPTGPTDDYLVFAEPMIVSVSNDLMNWQTFPFDDTALAQVSGVSGTPSSLLPSLSGLAGITPSFCADRIEPDYPLVWDTSGKGGVSGMGGDAFDLADVGLSQARYVRLKDSGQNVGFAGETEGADVDAVVAIHSQPVAGVGTDTDGDGLTDAEEISLGTSAAKADTDGGGMDDGQELAECKDPLDPGDDLLIGFDNPNACDSGGGGGGGGGGGVSSGGSSQDGSLGCLALTAGTQAPGSAALLLVPLALLILLRRRREAPSGK